MSDLPKLTPELLDGEIFSRLPVKSLLRFRCVSKHYRALIDSPDFIKSQLLKCCQSNQSIIIWDTVNIYSANLNTPEKPILLNHPFEQYHSRTPLNTPIEDRGIVLGYCNGLICLLKYPRIVLWNPSTQKHHDLPVTESKLAVNPCNDIQYVGYGFGYDDVNDDYKLLRISQYYNEDKNKVKIYSLKSDSWRSLDDCRLRFAAHKGAPSCHGVFVGHSVHWLVSDKDGLGIAYIFAFHLGTEKFHGVPHPRFPDKNVLVNMDGLGGKLCLHCIYDRSHIDIWAMNTYGVKESWTKLFSVAILVDVSRFEFPTPVTYSKDGNQVLWQVICGGKLFWYDLHQNFFEDASIRGIPEICMAFLSVESLVKLPHAANTGLIEHKRKSKKRDDFLAKEFKLNKKLICNCGNLMCKLVTVCVAFWLHPKEVEQKRRDIREHPS